MPQDVPGTNDSPTPPSGLLASNTSTNSQWTPETVLSTLPPHTAPQPNTTSPLPFLHLLTRLKTTKREGWRRFGFAHGESIADHMYRMSIITLLCPASLSARLDIARCTRMALVHDMAESLVGDITPVDGVSKPEKNRRETATMDYLTKALLGRYEGGVPGEAIREVWMEYEDGVTEESKFVHDVDKIELLLQMVEYEKAREGKIDLGEFSWVAGKVVLPEMKTWAKDILAEREEYWEGLGIVPSHRPVGSEELVEEKIKGLEEYYGKE